MIQETLEAFERNGGPDAFINIKYMVPVSKNCEEILFLYSPIPPVFLDKKTSLQKSIFEILTHRVGGGESLHFSRES